MKFENIKYTGAEEFHDQVDLYLEHETSNDTSSNTTAYWDVFKQKLDDKQLGSRSETSKADETKSNALASFTVVSLPERANPQEKLIDNPGQMLGGTVGRSIQLNMLPGLEAAGQAAIRDLQANSAIGSAALQGAIRQAAQMGKLPEFIEAFNNGLKGSGIANVEVQIAPPGVVPGGGGQNLPKEFVLKDTMTGRAIDTIGPINPPGVIVPVVKPETPEPSYTDLIKSIGKLTEASINGDKLAADLLKKAEARLIVMDLEAERTPHKAERIVKKLSDRALDGDLHARAALVAVLVSSADKVDSWKQLALFSDNHFAIGRVPDLSKHSIELTEAVQLSALKGLKSTAKFPGLSSEEASALALVLKDHFDRATGDGAIPQAIRAIFQEAYSLKRPDVENQDNERKNADRTEKLLDGLFQVIAKTTESDSPGTKALIYEYARVAGSKTNQFVFDSSDKGKIRVSDIGRGFARQVDTWHNQALKGDRVAIEILAVFAGGVGKYNHLVNPGIGATITVQSDVQGSRLAVTAADTLVKAASTAPEIRKLILESLSSNLQNKLLPDGSIKLATLGRVAALNPDDVPDSVTTALRAGVADKNTHESAIRGMMALVKHLDARDLEVLSKHISPCMISELHGHSYRMPADKGARLADLIADKLLLRYPHEQRLDAIQALAAIGPHHATENSITALCRLGGKTGKQFIDDQLKKDEALVKEPEKREKMIAELQKQAGLALLTVAERAPNPELQTEAFNAFASHDWGQDSHLTMQRELWSEFHGRLVKLARDNPKNLAIQSGVPKLAYNLDRSMLDSPRRPDEPPRTGNPSDTRLAASFRDRGGVMTDDALIFFTNIAISRHGVSTVEKVSDRIALFNALPADVRKQVTGFSGTLTEGKDLDLTGKSMSASTFNKLPDHVRKALTGKEALLPASEILAAERLSGKVISGATFNGFSKELRRELSGQEAALPIPQSISLLGRSVDAATFNALPAVLRRQMFGTDNLMPEPETLKIEKNFYGSDWNKLPQKIREMLLPEGHGRLADSETRVIAVKDKVIDSKTFNRLTDEQRKILSGSASTLAERTAVPDLSRVRLSAEQFNKLSAEQMRTLGQPVARVAAGRFVSLQGQTIEAREFNLLPADVRTAISGSPEHLAPGRIIQDLSSIMIDASTFNALPKEQRVSLTSTTERLDPAIVLGQLANGTICDASSLSHILFGPPDLEQTVIKMAALAQADSAKADQEVHSLVTLREKVSEQLHDEAVSGVGFFRKFGAYLLDDLSEGQRKFIRSQDGKIFDLKSLDQAIQDYSLYAQMARARMQIFEIAKGNQDFAKSMRQGYTESADQLAMRLFGKYGSPVLKLAPDLNRALLKNGEGVNSGTTGRLFKAGQSQFPVLQINQKLGTAEGFEQGLNMLIGIKAKEVGDRTKLPILFADAPEIRKEALQGIDSDPTVQKLNSLSQAVSEQLGSLTSQVQAMKKRGDKFQEFIDDSTRRANIVKEALNGLNDEDITRLKKIRKDIATAIKADSIVDPEALAQLKQRFDALDKALMLFDPGYDKIANQKERMERRDRLTEELEKINQNSWNWNKTQPPNDALFERLNSKYEEVSMLRFYYWAERKQQVMKELQQVNGELNQRTNIEKLVNFMSSPEARKESTFRQWLNTDATELIGAAVGAVIVTALVVASFGTAIPLIALAAVGTVGFITGREITKEIQHQYGVRTDGSLLGDYQRGRMVECEDGLDRPMTVWRDVAAPLAGELAIGTAIGWAGGGVGTYIGQNLRSSAKTVFINENKHSVFARFAKEVMQQGAVQTAVLPAFMAADAGAQQTLRSLGAAIDEGNMLTSFLAAVAVSIPFGWMHGRVLPRSGRITNPGEIARVGVKPGEPHLQLSHSTTPEAIDSYIQSAKTRGSQIEQRGNGHFIETTKEGLSVGWKPAAEIKTAAHVSVDISTHLSLTDPQTAKSRITIRKPDHAQAQRLKSEMDALLEPVLAKEAAIAKLESSYRPFELDIKQQIEKLPYTTEGDKQFCELKRQLKDRQKDFQQEKRQLEFDAYTMKQQILTSDRFQQLRLARSIAENNFPAGEYQLRINGHDVVKLSVGMETFSLDGVGFGTRYTGDPVPVGHVQKLIDALEAARIKPERVVINNTSTGHNGSILQRGSNYEITINVGASELPVRLIFNHETGHLYDLRFFRESADPQTQQEIMDTYRATLLKAGGPVDIIARRLGKQSTPELREQLANELCDPDNHYFTADRINTFEDRLKYLASRGEVFAEMFMLHQEKVRITKEQGREPSYEELLRDFTGKHNPQRAEMMISMSDVFTALEKNAFNAFKITHMTTVAAPGRPALKSLTDHAISKTPAEQLVDAKPVLDAANFTGRRGQTMRIKYETEISKGHLNRFSTNLEAEQNQAQQSTLKSSPVLPIARNSTLLLRPG